jgi:hypothetical protein
MEMMNRREDYLFEGYRDGQPSPLVECLNAGWRVGLLGVTDEHGTDWGHPDGKGRAGLWVGIAHPRRRPRGPDRPAVLRHVPAGPAARRRDRPPDGPGPAPGADGQHRCRTAAVP